jgi:hypothetical protein
MRCEYYLTCMVKSERCFDYDKCNLRHYELMLESWKRQDEAMFQRDAEQRTKDRSRQLGLEKGCDIR